MHGISPFIDTAAVEAWDAWFRWRERDRLRDLSIEATWQRVVGALTAPAGTMLLAADLMDACSSWRLLLDERIIASAGTAAANWPADGLGAAINVPMFVRRRFSDQAHIDIAGLAQAAKLAVRALDKAVLLRTDRRRIVGLRVGIIGLADALAFCGTPYGSAAALRYTGQVCSAIAEGCFEESVRLAHDDGPGHTLSAHALERAAARGFATELVRDARQRGLRHAQLTAITSQPRLALLANNVADALDPLRGENHVHRISTPNDTRSVRSSGYALTISRGPISSRPLAVDVSADHAIDAQLRLRTAAQEWIDEPIAYPLTVAHAPSAADWLSVQKRVREHGLAETRWRLGADSIAPIPTAGA